jgi:formate hydrogenlyase transcriptional activator
MEVEFEGLQSLALRVGEARTTGEVFKLIVDGLAAQRAVALARVWLILPGDRCDSCLMRSNCENRERCLHLVASAGNPIESGEDWSRLNGDFQRIPLVNTLKVGEIGMRGEPISIGSDLSQSHWTVRPDWAMREGVVGFAGQPLVFRGEILGVLALFRRAEITPIEFNWLRIFADHAAIAIANARSIDALKSVEEKLRQDQVELQRMIDALPVGIDVMDSEGRSIYANRASLEYTGLRAEEVAREDFRSRIFHPDDLRNVREERERLLAHGLPFEIEQRARRWDGQYRWFLIRYNPLRDEEERLVRWYATGTDIEDRKRAEDRTKNENVALREEIDHSSMFEEIVGSSGTIRQVLARVARVAPTDSTVLISGETGTGKELIARAVHKRSNRSARAFIRVNCGAISPSLAISELFGHEKGAFTGALQRRIGYFEAADGGTIFFDEIGDLPMETQNALLRVLQEREFERIGGNRPLPVDVRVLAATNRDLKLAVEHGSFREDLFYRLNVFPIRLPSLRERVDDVPLLVEYFINRYAEKAGKKFCDITSNTLAMLQEYHWPGNIRELQNVVERAVILCDGETFSIDETWLSREAPTVSGPVVPLVSPPVGRLYPLGSEEEGETPNHSNTDIIRRDNLRRLERDSILAALKRSNQKVSGPGGAAELLGINPSTLQSRMRSLGIKRQF